MEAPMPGARRPNFRAGCPILAAFFAARVGILPSDNHRFSSTAAAPFVTLCATGWSFAAATIPATPDAQRPKPDLRAILAPLF
jgi:hypothetical protein